MVQNVAVEPCYNFVRNLTAGILSITLSVWLEIVNLLSTFLMLLPGISVRACVRYWP